MSPRRLPSTLAALTLLTLAGCSLFAPTVSVDDVGPTKVYDQLTSYALNSGHLSDGTKDVLHTHNLTDIVKTQPRAALARLHATMETDPTQVGLFALSELAFLIGKNADDHDAFLASAVYAWHYLFDEQRTTPLNPYDRRVRWACDLYNHGLMRALTDPSGHEIVLAPGRRELPIGAIDLDVDRSDFPWTPEQVPSLLPADHFEINGLTLRLRDAGLGVALIASPAPEHAAARIGPEKGVAKTPATVFLRVRGGLRDTDAGLRGTLELHHTLDKTAVTVGDRTVPLESDTSAAIAHALDRSPLWKFSLNGLLHGDTPVKTNKLRFVRTPEPGRVPVVFVHGTASNPAYWAEMFNVLLNDVELRDRAQFWFFQYASGNPLMYSAMTLREQLDAALDAIDPDGTDPALQRMVLIGHSQGGLVCRLMVVDGDMGWLAEVADKPVDELGLDDAQLAMLERAFEFDPLPYVERTVFISTPHRGSFLSDLWMTSMLAKMIAIPGEVTGTLSSLFGDGTKLPPGFGARIPTSLDNMKPSHPLLRVLNSKPFEPGLHLHSIIPVGDADPADPAQLATADDGVVEYTSAHLDGVDSELRIAGGHSCQSDPLAISEVRRILLEHLADG